MHLLCDGSRHAIICFGSPCYSMLGNSLSGLSAARLARVCREFLKHQLQTLQKENTALQEQLQAHEKDTSLQRTLATDSGDWPDLVVGNARLQAELKVSQQRSIDLQRRVDKLLFFFMESSAHFRAATRDVLGWRFDPIPLKRPNEFFC
jgi:predicted nuclease with TOPRIM domain